MPREPLLLVGVIVWAHRGGGGRIGARRVGGRGGKAMQARISLAGWVGGGWGGVLDGGWAGGWGRGGGEQVAWRVMVQSRAPEPSPQPAPRPSDRSPPLPAGATPPRPAAALPTPPPPRAAHRGGTSRRHSARSATASCSAVSPSSLPRLTAIHLRGFVSNSGFRIGFLSWVFRDRCVLGFTGSPPKPRPRPRPFQSGRRPRQDRAPPPPRAPTC